MHVNNNPFITQAQKFKFGQIYLPSKLPLINNSFILWGQFLVTKHTKNKIGYDLSPITFLPRAAPVKIDEVLTVILNRLDNSCHCRLTYNPLIYHTQGDGYLTPTDMMPRLYIMPSPQIRQLYIIKTRAAISLTIQFTL